MQLIKGGAAWNLIPQITADFQALHRRHYAKIRKKWTKFWKKWFKNTANWWVPETSLPIATNFGFADDNSRVTKNAFL